MVRKMFSLSCTSFIVKAFTLMLKSTSDDLLKTKLTVEDVLGFCVT